MARRYKLQGGMEYLAVYGWATLVIVTSLFGLYQLGVFNSNRFVPSASPGSCRVFRSSSSAGSYVLSLTGLCTGRTPKFVAVFNGASYIEEGSMNLLSSNNFAASFWVQIQTPVTTFNGILDKGSQSSPKGWYFWSSGNTCGNGQGVIFNAGPGRICWPFGNQGWHFVVGVYNSTTSREYLYVDGALVGNTKGSSSSQSYPLVIGAESNFKSMFSGSISNIQIYNSSLDQATVQAMYKYGIGGAPIKLQNLVAWWPLNGDTVDYSGNSNNGQLNRVGVSFSSSWANGYTQP
jgi:hypothetical protein